MGVGLELLRRNACGCAGLGVTSERVRVWVVCVPAQVQLVAVQPGRVRQAFTAATAAGATVEPWTGSRRHHALPYRPFRRQHQR